MAAERDLVLSGTSPYPRPPCESAAPWAARFTHEALDAVLSAGATCPLCRRSANQSAIVVGVAAMRRRELRCSKFSRF